MAGTGSVYEIGHIFDEKRSHPRLHLCLLGWTALEQDRSTPCISWDLDTEAEIDHAVQEIKADLDRAARDAKIALRRRLAAYKANQHV